MKDKLIKYGYYLMILIIAVIGTYILINWLIPLFFSCLIVLILQPLLAKEIEMLKVKNSFIAKGIIIFNYLLFVAMIIGIIIFSVVQIYKVLEILPDYLYRLYNLFSQNHYIIDATKYLDIIYSSSMSVVESVSSEFITGLITVVMKIPSILFDLVFIVITSLFMLLDYQRIDKLVIQKYSMVSLVVDTVKDVLSNMFKAYFMIMIITFIELWVGFMIMKLDNPVMLACIIAIFDFMPVLGIDMIMIPWIIISALTNKVSMAFGLLIIYMVIVVTKNILEPKLIAKNLGVSPLVSLIGMYLGMKILGVMGLIIVPTLLMIIIQIIKVKQEITR
ncbi:AI-2E family transporter [Thomasclavelia cocleata]|nr:AI-2E family transporter [Thomasclavelia cocleata]MCR1961250.1 AI-2E family transporter [Thomasclavelia cocleata]NDO42679.1 AI-2E family transporter [Thomasclavelia cocleata]PJN80463.1 AI-2E family transporter [Thomasclavelia cocleata]